MNYCLREERRKLTFTLIGESSYQRVIRIATYFSCKDGFEQIRSDLSLIRSLKELVRLNKIAGKMWWFLI